MKIEFYHGISCASCASWDAPSLMCHHYLRGVTPEMMCRFWSPVVDPERQNEATRKALKLLGERLLVTTSRAKRREAL